MKKGLLVVVIFGVFAGAFAGGMLVQQRWSGLLPGISDGGEMSASVEAEPQPLYWVAPMDANYRRDKPGKSPMGMDLVPVYEEEQAGDDEGAVRISAAVENNLGVRTSPVVSGPLTMPINTVGYVAFDESRLTHIHSRVDGWVEVLNVTSEGDRVKKGQTLYELYSPTLVNAQEEYLAAYRSGNAVLLKASRRRLQSFGLTSLQINALEKRGSVDQRVRLVAEADGIVSKLNVREGMFVKPATEVMSLGVLDHVWVIAEVFERQSGWVMPGQKVLMTVAALPGRTWEGTVDYLYPVLDSKTRTLRVRILFDNQDFTLKPNMFANLTFFSQVKDEVLSVPREAVIRGGRHDRVVVRLEDGKFTSRLVKTGQEFDGHIEIMDGLQKGEAVVTSAQFLIDSESNIDAEIARMENPEQERAIDDISSMNAISSISLISSVMATGKVVRVMPEMRTVTITHDPIDVWGWPTMKMDFELAEGISVKGLKEGTNVKFELTKQGDWEYQVTKLQIESSMDVSDDASTESKVVIATGEVSKVMPETGMVEVLHDPIPEWQWPTMRMSFLVSSEDYLKQLNPGQKIRFKLSETEDGDYVLSSPEELSAQ